MKYVILMLYSIPLGIALVNLIDDIEMIISNGIAGNLNFSNVVIPALVFLTNLLGDEVIKLRKEVEELKSNK